MNKNLIKISVDMTYNCLFTLDGQTLSKNSSKTGKYLCLGLSRGLEHGQDFKGIIVPPKWKMLSYQNIGFEMIDSMNQGLCSRVLDVIHAIIVI